MDHRKKDPFFEICPVVCAAGPDYQILVPAASEALMCVTVANNTFYNDCCGVKISSCHVHKFTVPAALLDKEKRYTVTYEIIYREAYCSKKEAPVSREFRFYPLEKQTDIRLYHLSDVHGRRAAAIKAAGYFGAAPDVLVLNGDISSSTQTVKESLLPLEIAFAVTKGERPCIITRGNHDLRGKYAERLGEFYPLDNGLFYYEVKLGPLWALVLDCGEDKNDDHREYAGTVAFHAYRSKETAFLKALTEGETRLYDAPDVKYKIVISHIPFMHTDYDPKRGVHEFDIEQDTYAEWVRLLNDFVRPQFGLFGHVHATGVIKNGERYNQKGFIPPLVLGGRPDGNDVVGCAVTLREQSADIVFNSGKMHVVETDEISFC